MLSVTFPPKHDKTDEKAEAVIRRAVEKLGGEKYLQVKSISGAGNSAFARQRDYFVSDLCRCHRLSRQRAHRI